MLSRLPPTRVTYGHDSAETRATISRLGAAGKNKPVDITVFDQVRIAGGRTAEHWGVPDRFALLAQTGLLGRLAGG